MKTDFVVDARELHKELDVETRFNDWIKRRIKKYKYCSGKDFKIENNPSESERGGRNKTDYIITQKMADDLYSIDKYRL